MDIAILIPIIVALIAPIGAYLLAARKLSGTVQTSTADELWQESRSIREDYRARLAEAAERTARLEARVSDLEATNASLVQENLNQRMKIIELESVISRQIARIEELESIISLLKKGGFGNE